eukprot:TRINITY_DN7317_c0_g1_i1.p1 TRINITY_DN7317_c0_g1~~TRINITY_DN7317_c0_g1_i1.p1  ORF type:complete len:366 (-),score=37.19 TRINITY_DN7317_c0_g1_i1:445-1542(-)
MQSAANNDLGLELRQHGGEDADDVPSQENACMLRVCGGTVIAPGSQYSESKSMANPWVWASITLATAIVAAVAVRPTSCTNLPKCMASYKESSYLYNAFAATGLGTVFLHELASLLLSYRSVQQAEGLIRDLSKMLLPSALLCITFAVLFAENMILYASSTPWYAHSASLGQSSQDGTLVYTIFYVEWLINVPILLTLAGYCALELPLDVVARPIVVTNVYIIAAWSCYFISNAAARWSMVALSFAMYAWASYDMAQWVVRFLRDNPESRSDLYLRPCLAILLIVIFGIYGIVFLCRLSGTVTTLTERLFYTFMDIGSKLIVSMVFTGVRSSEYHALLLDMLVNTNTVFQREAHSRNDFGDTSGA